MLTIWYLTTIYKHFTIEGQKSLDHPIISRHFCPKNGTRYKKEKKGKSRKQKKGGKTASATVAGAMWPRSG